MVGFSGVESKGEFGPTAVATGTVDASAGVADTIDAPARAASRAAVMAAATVTLRRLPPVMCVYCSTRTPEVSRWTQHTASRVQLTCSGRAPRVRRLGRPVRGGPAPAPRAAGIRTPPRPRPPTGRAVRLRPGRPVPARNRPARSAPRSPAGPTSRAPGRTPPGTAPTRPGAGPPGPARYPAR